MTSPAPTSPKAPAPAATSPAPAVASPVQATSPAAQAASSTPATAQASVTPHQPPPTNNVIEVDEAPNEVDDDADSALGYDNESSTASITSSILHYRTIQGRTFHSERGNSSYWGANDESQSEAMDIAHHAFTLSQDGRLHLAPLSENIQKVLDVGCGTGLWAIDFADEHPNCEVIGTDISPIQPAWVPPNVKFEIEDCTQEWTFKPEEFDYIHIRYLLGSIADWTDLFTQCYKTLKPGAWLESFETTANIESDDGTMPPDSASAEWGGVFIKASEGTGRSFTILEAGEQRKAMEAAGFVDIQEWDSKFPLSPWPKDPKLKEVGQYAQIFATQDTEGFVTFVCDRLGWSKEEVLLFTARFRKEVRDPSIHTYIRLKTVWGRKPE